MPSDASLVSMTRIRELIAEGFEVKIYTAGGASEAFLEKLGANPIQITVKNAHFAQGLGQPSPKGEVTTFMDVTSSHIWSYSYRTSDGTLEVRFKAKTKGEDTFHPTKLYRYYKVPATMFRDFQTSESRTRFLNTVIAKACEYHEVTPPDSTPARAGVPPAAGADLTGILAQSIAALIIGVAA